MPIINNNSNNCRSKGNNNNKNNNIIHIIPVHLSIDIKPHDNLDVIILESLKHAQVNLCDGDIVVIAQKIVSKAEGRIINLEHIKPSAKSLAIAKENDKDARIVELILNESKEVLRLFNGILIVETKQGFICANAGIDQSNVQDGYNNALLLPVDADRSANKIRNSLRKKTGGKDVAVVITDTFGRPFREGQTNVAIGIAGIEPIKSYIGTTDMYGKKLKVTEIAVADEIASAAELSMGKLDRVPIVIMRGYKYQKADEKSSISKIIRSKEKDLFR
jgi:coenzyme F420-0:L-glutamate ligase / coenzyme F420-1:gamma-L-glutamate ligase